MNVAAAVLIPLALVVLAVLGYGFYKKCYLRQNRYVATLLLLSDRQTISL